MSSHRPAPRILLVGAGYVGLYTALQLERLLEVHEADVTLVSPENFMLYRPLLPEVASGTLQTRHAVVPLRSALRRTRLLTGRLTELHHDRRVARVQPYVGPERDVGYDQVVIGLGSMSRVPPIPGLAERAVGFTSITEAFHLRNHILSRLEAGFATVDSAARRRALTFCFVGGGYSGVEALAELQDMAVDACRWYPGLDPGDLRFVLVEATGRLLPSLDERLAAEALDQLRRRQVEVHLDTRLQSAAGDTLQLSDGTRLAADTLVWAAGVAPHRLVRQLGLPVDDAGRLLVDPTLAVHDVEGAWAAGDGAAVPDLVGGGLCPPTAQHAVRQARQLGTNLAAVLHGEQVEPLRYRSKGMFVTLGMRRAVAEIGGHCLSGLAPWLVRRAYYATQIPTANRKLRVLVDWAAGLPFPHDAVNLASLQQPDAPFAEAADRQVG